MCGIAGIFGASSSDQTMDTVLAKLKHRGPDDDGTYFSKEAVFGHTRLSIIDVDGGKQPIFNEDGTVCIVFNGEIYNYKVLRNQLSRNHSFTTNTDTEVIIHLYEEYGEKCIEKLDGMYSLAIYDENHGLLLARDPVGIKPLYIGRLGETIYFASEMKALLGVVPEFNEFPAGHSYSTQNGMVKRFSIPVNNIIPIDVHEAQSGIRHYLERAVEKRLMSDVPLGSFLSGGLDSSIISAIAARMLPEINTFSVGMENSEDIHYARMVAEYLGTKHHEYIYTLEEMLDVLPEVIYFLESYDAALVRSAIPNYFLARLAGEHVKVVLSGEGADELFCGYHYLKGIDSELLHKELVEITSALHNTNLQRCDRMTMAHGIEGRVPFLDVDMIHFAFSIPIELKLGPQNVEKWILRESFRDYLPNEIVDRRKSKFSEGAGSMHAIELVAETEITDSEFEKEACLLDGSRIKNKEELMYYRLFRKFYPAEAARKAVGASRSL